LLKVEEGGSVVETIALALAEEVLCGGQGGVGRVAGGWERRVRVTAVGLLVFVSLVGPIGRRGTNGL